MAAHLSVYLFRKRGACKGLHIYMAGGLDIRYSIRVHNHVFPDGEWAGERWAEGLCRILYVENITKLQKAAYFVG